MRKLYLSLFSIFLAVSTAGAQEVLHMSLKECMDYALKHNYDIRNANVDIVIRHVQNNETLSASYPHINGKAEIDNFYVPQRSFVDASSFNPSVPAKTVIPISFTLPYASSAGITVSQLLFEGDAFVAWKARKTVMEIATQNANVTEENIRYNVYKAYNSLVIGYRQYDIIMNSLVYARSLEHDIEVTRQNGFAEKIDVERTSVQVNNLATDSIRASNMLKVSEDVLKYQIGMSMGSHIIATDTVVAQLRGEALKLLTEEKNYERVPEFTLLNTTERLNEYDLMRYRINALPTLNAFWGYGVNTGSYYFENMFNNQRNYLANSTIGVQLNLPIYNGSLRTNQVREARLNIEKSRNSIEHLKQTIDFQVSISRETLRNAIAAAQGQRRNMELADDVLDLAQKKYKAGVGSNLEVTQAQTDQLRAQTFYFNSLLDVINAEADLKKALGLLK
jgi:outer membrane protein